MAVRSNENTHSSDNTLGGHRHSNQKKGMSLQEAARVSSKMPPLDKAAVVWYSPGWYKKSKKSKRPSTAPESSSGSRSRDSEKSRKLIDYYDKNGKNVKAIQRSSRARSKRSNVEPMSSILPSKYAYTTYAEPASSSRELSRNTYTYPDSMMASRGPSVYAQAYPDQSSQSYLDPIRSREPSKYAYTYSCQDSSKVSSNPETSMRRFNEDGYSVVVVKPRSASSLLPPPYKPKKPIKKDFGPVVKSHVKYRGGSRSDGYDSASSSDYSDGESDYDDDSEVRDPVSGIASKLPGRAARAAKRAFRWFI